MTTLEFAALLLIAFASIWIIGVLILVLFGEPNEDYWSDL